jgi:hypothetical protein
MWAGKDNGKDVNVKAATKYCQGLRLGGYSDWRLPTIDELEDIYDGSANAPGLGAGKRADEPATWHVKGSLFLSGREWSSTERIGDGGFHTGLFWVLDFSVKYKGSSDGHFDQYYHRALCVRRPGK